MVRKKTRGGGGGRKKNDEPSSVVMLRIRQAMRDKLQELADQHSRGNLSGEIKSAAEHWVARHDSPELHNQALATVIALIAGRIERLTGRQWTDDPLTSQLVRDLVVRFINHLMPPAQKPVAVSEDIKNEAELLLLVLKHSMPPPGTKRSSSTIIIDDADLAMILRDLEWRWKPKKIETREELVASRKRWEEEMKEGKV